jgi:phosphate transport system substrate-binding protein
VAYNLPGLNAPVNFTPQALAGIFLGRITRWDDPVLRAANPQLALPSAGIVAVHRTDACAITFVWTDYLSRVSPEWHSLAGAATSVNWPTGVGAQREAGVSGLIRQTPYSLGYLDMASAAQARLAVGRIRDAAGDFVLPSPASVAAAGSSPYNVSTDGRASIANSPARMAYPISMFHWFILPGGQSDRSKKEAVVDLVQWCLTSGQSVVALHGYVPLPQGTAASASRELQRYQ